jgi:hypothetical protein
MFPFSRKPFSKVSTRVSSADFGWRMDIDHQIGEPIQQANTLD